MKEVEAFFLDLVAKGELSVDNKGRVWRHVEHYWRTEYRPLATPVRAETLKSPGYLKIDHRNRSIYAHQLVYIVKCGAIPEGYEVNHENGVKTDNRPANLEAMTRTGNMRHAFRTGLNRSFGENNHFAKLSAQDVRQIWHAHYVEHQPQPEIAQRFGTTQSNVSMIVTGRTWTRITSQLERK